MNKTIGIVLCTLLGGLAADGAAERGFLCPSDCRANEISVGFELPTDGAPLVVPATVSGGACLLLVDTGSAYTVLDVSLVPAVMGPEWVLPLREPPIISHKLEINVSGIARTLDEFGALDLSHIRDALELPIMGLLGMDFLKHYSLIVDSDNRRFQIARKVPEKAFSFKCDLTLLEGARPFFIAQLENRSEPILLDTGSTKSVCVDSSVFDRINLRSKAFYSAESVAVFDGRQAGRWFSQPKSFQIDKCDFGELFIERNREEDAGNHVGLTFLSRMNFCIDFVNRTFAFEPSKLANGKDCADRTGALLIWSRVLHNGNETFTVAHVRTGSDAEANGIKPGDNIVSIQRATGEKFEGLAIYGILRMPRPIALELHALRQGKPIVITLPGLLNR